MYWSLIATAVVILSIENAKSVSESSATTFKKLKLFLCPKLSESLILDALFEKTLENEESLESFKEKGYLVFENLINESLCDLFFSEVLKKLSINLNKLASEKDVFRINIPIDQ